MKEVLKVDRREDEEETDEWLDTEARQVEQSRGRRGDCCW